MILCQPLLNGLPIIFPPPLLYKPPLSFILEYTKTSLSSPLLSSSEVELSCHILIFLRLTLPLLTLLFLHSLDLYQESPLPSYEFFMKV